MDSNVTAQTFKPQKFLFVPPVSLFYSIRDLSTGLRKDTVAWPSSAPTTQQRTNEKKNDRTHKTQFKFFFFFFLFLIKFSFPSSSSSSLGAEDRRRKTTGTCYIRAGYLYRRRPRTRPIVSRTHTIVNHRHSRSSRKEEEKEAMPEKRDTTRFFNTTFTFVHDGKYAKVSCMCACISYL